MKVSLPLLLLVLLGPVFIRQFPSIAESNAALGSTQSTVNVLSFNIRYNNPDDGDYAWPSRKDWVASIVRFHGADLVGMQEVLRSQLDDLAEMLIDYEWYGVGRDDGKDAGEFAPIFYRRDRFELLESGEFWLSETPEAIGSQSWDAALPRIATWARFRDLQGGEEFIHLNTHFDHRGEVARVHSAALIVERLGSLGQGSPVVVTGDFNVPPESEVYTTLAADLIDTRLASELPPHGPEGTFGGFTVELDETSDRIDYVFVKEGTRVLRYGAMSDQWNGRYPSDHLPVLAEIQWP